MQPHLIDYPSGKVTVLINRNIIFRTLNNFFPFTFNTISDLQ
jgi:hypothetical protein